MPRAAAYQARRSPARSGRRTTSCIAGAGQRLRLARDRDDGVASHNDFGSLMKRDMDTLRSLLLWMEEQETDMFILQMLPGLPDHYATVAYVQMLKSGGFLDQSSQGTLRVSWMGYEFLDKVRDPEIWRKTKDGAEKVGSWSVKLLADLATGYIKAKAVELGLPI